MGQTIFLETKPECYRGEIRYQFIESDLGRLFAAETLQGLCQLEFIGAEDPQQFTAALARRWSKAQLMRGNLFSIKSPICIASLFLWKSPLHICGTDFQQKVWQAIRRIPPASTSNYGELASQMSHSRSARAVGQACGANAVAVIIPCHRIIKASGEIGQYRWGTNIKKQLLTMEKASESS